MKVLTFNINGIRARLHQLEAIIEKISPDVIALQETKTQDENFPVEAIRNLGYDVLFHGQKSHYGVATMSRIPMQLIHKNFPIEENDVQRRTLITKHQIGNLEWTILNGYFPQGENRDHPTKFANKQLYYKHLRHYVADKIDTPIILLGDFNIAPHTNDVGIDNADSWAKRGVCSFLPEEREWYQQLLDFGFVDTWRHFNPVDNNHFSWFDYRTKAFARTIKKGLRIDHILTTEKHLQNLTSVGIEYDIRGMEKPSDHVPVWAEWKSN